MALNEYKRKRNFKSTPEPVAKKISKDSHTFVIQKHHARRLHYDFRLELDGVLKSWAIPKGPSLDPSQKRLAVEVEDHPLSYGTFEGVIPKGNYGAGKVVLWDKGHWNPLEDPKKALKKGSLEFELNGKKLKGRWHLVRMRSKNKKQQWLLIKGKDSVATTKYDITKKLPNSINDKKNYLNINDINIQLAKLTSTPPQGKQWIHEIKYDGYRTLTHIKDNKIILYTRSHLNWTDKYKIIAKELAKIKAHSAWLDGEIVAIDKSGKSNFSLLQSALKKKDSSQLVYYIFDLLELDGRDLRNLPQIDRKIELKKILKKIKSNKIFYSDHFATPGKATLLTACKLGLEGIISKDKDQTYNGGRSSNWLKSKCINGQEFVIGGYSLSDKRHFKSLLLGVYKNGKLAYVGKVGTGFNSKNTSELLKEFKSLKTNESPFDKNPKEKNICWLQPKLVAEIKFRGWTKDHILRQASFKSLREDKPAKEIVIEGKSIMKSNHSLTNADKILIQDGKITKQHIADYYKRVEKFLVPLIKERPLSLLRCPNGIQECFFQKNIPQVIDSIYSTSINYKKSDVKSVNYVQDSVGILALVQLGVLELHCWGTHIDHYSKPDAIVFDLDPGPGVTLNEVRKAALLLKKILDKLQLKSFLKVSGGKGFHIHIPIEPLYDWDTIKNFSKAIAQQMTDMYPDKYLIKMSKSKRKGKIFIDYLRNGFGATSIAPYSLRARPNGPLALPISWKYINHIKSDQFKLKNISLYLKKYRDTWSKYSSTKQTIKILNST